MHDYEDFIPAQRLGRSLSVSADGTMIAYASDASGQFNLWTQPTGGGPARQLTFFTDHAVREVAWAPDGTRVAFTADTQGDEQPVYDAVDQLLLRQMVFIAGVAVDDLSEDHRVKQGQQLGGAGQEKR